jgi:hypothetical protein
MIRARCRADWTTLAAKLAEEVNYPNFKGEVHRRPDQQDKSGPVRGNLVSDARRPNEREQRRARFHHSESVRLPVQQSPNFVQLDNWKLFGAFFARYWVARYNGSRTSTLYHIRKLSIDNAEIANLQALCYTCRHEARP